MRCPLIDLLASTRAVVEAVQQDGTCWLGGTTWQGKGAMRISVSNWSTTTEDVERSVAAILRAVRRYRFPTRTKGAQ